MESPTPETKLISPFQPYTKVERIRQLNDIDKSITKLLQSAGLAIKTLTAVLAEPDIVDEESAGKPQTFTDATNTYLKALHSVDVCLKRQIFGLNEAGIIAKEKESPVRSEGQNADGSRVAAEKTTLDVGWLNSRSGKVGRDMEAELWAKSRAFLESMEIRKRNASRRGPDDDPVEDEDMGD